jgi:hypothetical protein
MMIYGSKIRAGLSGQEFVFFAHVALIAPISPEREVFVHWHSHFPGLISAGQKSQKT